MAIMLGALQIVEHTNDPKLGTLCFLSGVCEKENRVFCHQDTRAQRFTKEFH